MVDEITVLVLICSMAGLNRNISSRRVVTLLGIVIEDQKLKLLERLDANTCLPSSKKYRKGSSPHQPQRLLSRRWQSLEAGLNHRSEAERR